MTFRNAPLAIDGALIDSALLRVLAASAVEEGVGGGADLKVTANGTGLRVAAGIGNVLNRYKQTPDELYVTTNLGEALIDSSQMPPANVAARSHLVVLTVGDPEFTQDGHPWMLVEDPPDGEEQTFQYVRLHVIQNVPVGTTSFGELNLNYPGLELARLDIPANTTTITNAMIKDLRQIPEPRSSTRVDHVQHGGAVNALNGQGGVVGAFEQFPNSAFVDVKIPPWATVLKVTGFVEGISLVKAGNGSMRVAFTDGGATTATNINEPAPHGAQDRKNYNVGGEIAIPANYRGTTRRIRIEAAPATTAAKGFLETNAGTSAMLSLRFEEGLQ